MKNFTPLAAAMALVSAAPAINAQVIPVNDEGAENGDIPARAIILSGGENGINREVMAVLYDTNDLHFQDPTAPRFLLIDREGKTVFGIGGYVEGVAQYDFDGAIDNAGFVTFDIPTPADPSLRNRLGADATHSTLFMQLVSNTKWGVLTAYAQANFSGAHYGFKLKQAYVRLGDVTGGLTRSTFTDALSGVPTIDYQGPSGSVSAKNLLLQYKPSFGKHFTAAISVEMPDADYTTGPHNEAINQRFPDIPAFVQYQWDGGKSHFRVSGIFRNLSYRDLLTGENRFEHGWGAMVSGAVKCTKVATVFYQAAYGKGIGRYVNDLSGFGYDLITTGNGEMKAPGSLGIVGGVRVNLTKNLFVSGSYSLCRLYDQENLGPDTYRRGNYAVVNAFYSPLPDLQLGIEYVNGRRTDMNHEHNSANRIEAMVKYSF